MYHILLDILQILLFLYPNRLEND